jgi:hypothetical protein
MANRIASAATAPQARVSSTSSLPSPLSTARNLKAGIVDAELHRETLATLDSALEGLEVGDTVDEVLRGRLQTVCDTLEDILGRLGRSERGVEGAFFGRGPSAQGSGPSCLEDAPS